MYLLDLSLNGGKQRSADVANKTYTIQTYRTGRSSTRTRGSSTSRAVASTGSTTAAHTAGAGRIAHDATVAVVRSGSADGVRAAHVDAHGDPGQDTVGDVVAQEHVLDKGVDAVGGGFLGQDRVVGVDGQILGVCVVGVGSLDFGDEGLVEEELTNVLDAAGCEGAVDVEGGVCVGDNVDVRGAAGGGVLVFVVSSPISRPGRV